MYLCSKIVIAVSYMTVTQEIKTHSVKRKKPNEEKEITTSLHAADFALMVLYFFHLRKIYLQKVEICRKSRTALGKIRKTHFHKTKIKIFGLNSSLTYKKWNFFLKNLYLAYHKPT